MAIAPKEKKKNRRRRFKFQDFLISKDSNPYSVVKDGGISKSGHHHWTIGDNGAVNLKGIKEGVVNT
jgi:hypothetical protein